MKQKTLLLFILVASIVSGRSTDYFVSVDTGSTNNPGTFYSPFKKIQQALDVARYGDTINIEAGEYREHPFVPSSVTNVIPAGSITNPLVIQAWDTNSNGIIEASERPTIKGSKLITNGWTPVTNTSLLAWLTCSNSFDTNKIFRTSWPVTTNHPQTKIDTIHLVMESETNTLQQTRWEYYSNATEFSDPAGPREFSPGNPRNPVCMQAGTFYYDYADTNAYLYVWRTDGHIPDVDHPIEAYDCLDTAGDDGRRGTVFLVAEHVNYIHLKGLIFRHSNGTSVNVNNNDPDYPNALDSHAGVSLRQFNRLEYCDIQWMDFEGVSCGNSEITNCVISNNGCTGLSNPGAGGRIVNCLFETNNYRKFSIYWHAAAIKNISIGDWEPVPSVAGMIVSGNVFRNNKAIALWFDTISASPTNRCRIFDNFIYKTESEVVGDGAAAIFLELSSYFDIYNNVLSENADGISLGWSGHNVIAHNTVVCRLGAFGVFALPRSETARANNPSATNLVVYNIFGSTTAGNQVLSITRDKHSDDLDDVKVFDNCYKSNLVFNTAETAGIDVSLHTLWHNPGNNNNLEDRVYNAQLNNFAHYVGVDTDAELKTYFDDLSVTPGVNVSNIVVNPNTRPIFYNGLTPSLNAADPRYYELKWNSPAKDYASADLLITNDYAGPPAFFGHLRGAYPDLGAFELYDTDHDDLPDCWELFYAGNLTDYPSTNCACFHDRDCDGVSDEEEYKRDTEPNNNLSHVATLYADQPHGLSALDGFSATRTSNTKGPKQTIGQATSASKAGDTIRVATGNYTESVNISGQAVSMIIDGTVVLY